MPVHHRDTEARGGIRVAYVQTRPRFGQVAENLARAEAQIAAAAAEERLDLAVLPEMAFTGYSFRDRQEAARHAEPVPDGPTTRGLRRIARRTRAVIVCGLPERDGEGLYNSAVVVGPRGYLGCYRKVHLFDREFELYQPGDLGFPVFDCGGFQLGGLICFDWAFSESARELALGGADVLAHPANLVLPFAQQALRTRCIENRVFAVTANRVGVESRAGATLRFTGQSQIVDTGGWVLAAGGRSTPGVRSARIDLSRARDKHMTPGNDLLSDRRPEQYRRMCGQRGPEQPRSAARGGRRQGGDHR
jgi:predicted amidohydrolase